MQIPENPPDYKKYYRHMNKVSLWSCIDGVKNQISIHLQNICLFNPILSMQLIHVPIT